MNASAYLMVSLQSKIFKGADARQQVSSTLDKLEAKFRQHQWWNEGQGWKNILNNLRLIIQPIIFFHLITPWLKVFQIPTLKQGFFHLINIMNKFSFVNIENLVS